MQRKMGGLQLFYKLNKEFQFFEGEKIALTKVVPYDARRLKKVLNYHKDRQTIRF